ncbi:MAG TPA: translocation/assembly module TamB domain-containing protein [Candidatus Angelobacter sp.]
MTTVSSNLKNDERRGRRFTWSHALLSALLLGSIVCLALYLRSNAFHDLVRRKIIAQLELVTGGKVEIQSFTWRLSGLQFEARGVTIHGLETGGQSPFVRADRVAGQVKIISLLKQEIGLRSLVVDHPVIHVIVYPDGSTNQPMPKIQEGGSSAGSLFNMVIDQAEVNNAELQLNETKIAFDFSGEHLTGGMGYSQADKDYEGNLSVDRIGARYRNFEPVHGSLELHFVLRPAQAELKSLKFTVDHSVLQASGTLGNYGNPQIQLQYSALLDLKETGRIARVPQLQAGRLEVSGAASYANKVYGTQGTFIVLGLGWRNASWNVSGIDVSSPFTISADKISLPHLDVRAFGGTAQGDFSVVNWNAPPAEKKAGERGKGALRVLNMQAGQLAAAVSTSRFPLNKLNLAGTVSGDVTSAWTGPVKNAPAELKLEAKPPANASPSEIPVTGNLQATYHRATETTDVADLNLATRGIRVNATGTLGSTTAQLKVLFTAETLQEVQPVLEAWSPGTRMPVDVHGRTSFNGTLFGKLNGLSARGRLDLRDFDTLIGPVHTLLGPLESLATQKPPDRIHWDSVLADILVTPSTLSAQNGVLKRGGTVITFSGNAALNKGQFDEANSEILVNFQAQNISLADLQMVTGVQAPITGTVNADVRTRGTLRTLRGSGTLTASKLTIVGEPFSLFKASVNFAGEDSQFSNILLAHNGAQLTGSAAFNTRARSFIFDLSGANIELSSLRHLQPKRLSMAGHADFHASGSGTMQAPVINAQLNFRKLVLNGELVGDLSASAETHGENTLLHAKSNFENAAFSLDGSVRLRDNFPGQMTLKFEHLDFDPLIRAYLQAPLTGHSSMEGYVEVRGPMKTPRALSIIANINQLSAGIENVKVHNDGPLRFSLTNQSVHVDQFHLTGDETDVSLRGDANLAGTQALDLHAEAKVDLKLAQILNPNIISSGTATLAMHVSGTMGQPLMRGRMDITNGGLSVVDLPSGLSQINGHMVFAQDRVQIESLRAHIGGGDLDLGGFITYRNGLYFDVTATGNDVRLRYPPGLSASANASLRYTGSAQSSQLSGNMTIVRFAVDPHFDFAQYLAGARRPLRVGAQNPFLENLRLDVHIASTPELRVETSLAKFSGDADLRIRGTEANPAVLGRVNIAEGNVSFNGTKYRLERGDVTFSNPQVIQPIVNVEMSARVRDYDITIGFHGPIDRLSITYRSDPPLPSGDIIALLAFGRTKSQDIYSNQSTTTLTTSDTMLSQALTTASNNRVQKLFGVGSVKIDPQVIGAENSLGPRVTIEQQIQNNITLTYITNLTQSSSEQVIQVEYNVSRSISVVAVRDQNGILAFEVRIRKRKR